MTAMAANKGPRPIKQGLACMHQRPSAGTYKASKTGYWGAYHMQVDGVARPALGGSNMEAIATAVGTGNAGLLVTARRRNVKLAVIDPSAASALLYIKISTSTIYTVVSVYVATSAMSAITSTAEDVMHAIRANAEADALLRVVLAGTGASAIVAAGAASMTAIEGLGCIDRYYAETTASDATLTPSDGVQFVRNAPGDGSGFLMSGTAPPEGGACWFSDDQTITGTRASFLDLEAPYRGPMTQQGSTIFHYADLSAVR